MRGDNIPLLMLAGIPGKPDQAMHGRLTGILHQSAAVYEGAALANSPTEVSTTWQKVVCMGPLLVHEDELVMLVAEVELGRVRILHGAAVIAIS